MLNDDPRWDMLRDDAIRWDDCDDAIVGIAMRCSNEGLLVYDYDLLVSVFVKQGMTEEEAVEWIDHNILSAWVGEGTPLVLFGNRR